MRRETAKVLSVLVITLIIVSGLALLYLGHNVGNLSGEVEITSHSATSSKMLATSSRDMTASQNLPLNVPPHPIDIILGRPTRNSITASVLAYQNIEGFVEFGVQQGVYIGKTQLRQFPGGQPVELLIDSLQPDTQYYYRLFYRPASSGEFASTDEGMFHTQRGSNSTFTFTVQADSHLDSNSNPDVYVRTLANALSDKPDFHIDLGDTFMTDKYEPYTAAQKQYLAQRYYFGLIAHSAPLFLVLGNHDGERGRSLDGSENNMAVWSARVHTKYFPNPTPNDFYTGNMIPDKFVGLLQDYYAWEWGNSLFIVLDPFWFTTQQRGTNGNWVWTLGERQYDWLRQTLEKSQAKFKFVFIHHLVGGLDQNARGGVEIAKFFEWGGYNMDGSYGFTAKRPGWSAPIHQLLVQHQVSIVFHGHDHLFVKQDLDGIVYQEVPQPSTARYDQTSSAKDYGYVNGDILGSPGHLRVTVSESEATVDYVRAYLPAYEKEDRKNGMVSYSYTIHIDEGGKMTQHASPLTQLIDDSLADLGRPVFFGVLAEVVKSASPNVQFLSLSLRQLKDSLTKFSRIASSQ